MYSIKPISIFTGLFLLFATQALANPLTAAPATAHSLTAEKSLDHAPPPTNDDPCNAIEIDCTTTTISGSTLEATADEDCGGPSGGAGIWYVYHSEIDGSITLNTCSDNSLATDFDTDISVYTGSCNDLTCLEYRDGLSDCDFQAEITIDVLLDHTYYILIHGWEGEGNFEMSVDCDEEVLDCPGFGNIGDLCDDNDFNTFEDQITANCQCEGIIPDAGDVCSTALEIPTLPSFRSGFVGWYGDDYDQSDIPPFSSQAQGTQDPITLFEGNEVVFKYTPSEDEYVNFDLDVQAGISGLYIIEGCPFDSLIFSKEEVSISAGGSIVLLSGGVDYYIVVATSLNADLNDTEFNFYIDPVEYDCFDLASNIGDSCDDNNIFTTDDEVTEDCLCIGSPVPEGSFCSNALEVTALPFSTNDNTANYFNGYNPSDIPDFADDALILGNTAYRVTGFDVVYSYTPLEDGLIDMGLANHNGRGALQVFTGCPLEIGVASNARSDIQLNPRIIKSIPVTAGETYYILVSTDQSFPTPYTLLIANSVFDCPLLNADFGEPCDDGDLATTNDEITTDCQCEGILPPPDEKCGNAIEIASIPFFDSGNNTENFTDEYGSNDVPPLAPDVVLNQGDSGGLTSYIRGREAVYSYTPSTAQVIDVRIDDLNVLSDVGLYVFTGCPFELTRGYDREFGTGGFCELESLPVDSGVTYYITISTVANNQVTSYDLSVIVHTDDCPEFNADVGDPCNDGNSLTINETLTEDCECIGIEPIPGRVCEVPITIDSLPFSDVNNTSDYFNDYFSSDLPPFAPNAVNNGNAPLTINGNDVIYSYIPLEDDTLDFMLEGIGAFTENFGIWVFAGCPFSSQSGVQSGIFTSNMRVLEGVPVTAGVPYYVLVAKRFSEDFDYKLSIAPSDFRFCANLNKEFGDSCDDGYDHTINDVVTEECKCAGTPEPVTQCGSFTGLALLEFGEESSSSVTDEIEVASTEGIITDLDVVLFINHPNISEVSVTITSPEGTTIELISDLCSASAGDIEAILDDDGPSFNCSLSAPGLYGTFSPTGSLADLNGEIFNGTWSINVVDGNSNLMGGLFVAWCLLPTFEDPVVDFCDNTIEVIPSSGFLDNSVLVDQEGFIPSGVEQCVDNGTSVDTWFSFEAITSNMAVRVKGLDDYDIVLETWDACNGERLKCKNNRGEGDRETALYTNCVVGETYYFRVYDAGGDSLESSSLRASVAHFPITRLINADCASNLYSITDTIRAVNPQLEFPITQWTYEFTELEAPFDTYEVISPNGSAPGLRLNQFPSIEQGRSYSVRVKAALTSGFFYGDYGEVCTITILESSGIGLVESDADGQVQPDMIKLKLFPNPINGQEVSVALSNLPQSEGPIIVRVYDLVGRQVLSQRFSSSNDSATFMMNIEELSSGIYTVSAEVEGLIISKKLMIE